jgi:hypothetical protein
LKGERLEEDVELEKAECNVSLEERRMFTWRIFARRNEEIMCVVFRERWAPINIEKRGHVNPRREREICALPIQSSLPFILHHPLPPPE